MVFSSRKEICILKAIALKHPPAMLPQSSIFALRYFPHLFCKSAILTATNNRCLQMLLAILYLCAQLCVYVLKWSIEMVNTNGKVGFHTQTNVTRSVTRTYNDKQAGRPGR